MKWVPDAVLERLLEKWEPLDKPQYRFATCWGCGRKLLFGMWHCPKAYADAHLCRQCFRKHAV